MTRAGNPMQQSLLHIALVVRDYDEASRFFCDKLRFTLIEDTYQPEQDKRWVVVAPPGSNGTTILLARASTPEQEACTIIWDIVWQVVTGDLPKLVDALGRIIPPSVTPAAE